MVFHAETNFSPGRRWFWAETPTFSCQKHGFGLKNQFFPRKKMVLDRKTHFFLGKRWFWIEKPIFPREDKKSIFLEFGHIVCQKILFVVFPRKKLVCRSKTIFCLGKSWFFGPKASFS